VLLAAFDSAAAATVEETSTTPDVGAVYRKVMFVQIPAPKLAGRPLTLTAPVAAL
jgi:hypothetical protein